MAGPIVGPYAVLPVTSTSDMTSVVVLVIEVILLGLLVAVRVRHIQRDPNPELAPSPIQSGQPNLDRTLRSPHRKPHRRRPLRPPGNAASSTTPDPSTFATSATRIGAERPGADPRGVRGVVR